MINGCARFVKKKKKTADAKRVQKKAEIKNTNKHEGRGREKTSWKAGMAGELSLIKYSKSPLIRTCPGWSGVAPCHIAVVEIGLNESQPFPDLRGLGK